MSQNKTLKRLSILVALAIAVLLHTTPAQARDYIAPVSAAGQTFKICVESKLRDEGVNPKMRSLYVPHTSAGMLMLQVVKECEDRFQSGSIPQKTYEVVEEGAVAGA